jgi:TRAP-type C4-dicarboxylate transport system permease small subunit
MPDKHLKRTGEILLAIHDRLCDGLAWISAWMVLAMCLGMVYEVCMRYFFIRPTRWSADFTDYALLYTTFLSAAWLAKHGEHVNLTYLLDHLSPRSRHVMEAMGSFFCALVCAFIIWYGARDTIDAFSRGITMVRPIAIPKWPILGVVPFGCFLVFVQFVRNACRSLRASNQSAQEERAEREAL